MLKIFSKHFEERISRVCCISQSFFYRRKNEAKRKYTEQEQTKKRRYAQNQAGGGTRPQHRPDPIKITPRMQDLVEPSHLSEGTWPVAQSKAKL